MRALTLSMIGALALAGCVLDGDLKHRHPSEPEALADGWEIATPESVGLARGDLDAIHAELLREDRHVGTLGFLVVKDGKLVFETYLRTPADRDHFNHVQSVTKSITSMTFGVVRDTMGGPDLDTPIDVLFADEMQPLEPAKHAITLRHVLTMRSGLAFDNQDFSMEMWIDRPDDGLSYILEKPLYATPGARFYYRDADPQLIAYAIRELTGREEHEIARERLFTPLGISDYYWQRGADGETLGAHGLHLRPRDMAKLGQLMLDRGVWKGERLLSEAWIAESTSPQVDSTTGDGHGGVFPYGYYWWIVPGVGYAASGHGGQYILVVPEERLVIVQIARPDADLHGSHLPEFLELVAPLLE